MATIKVDFTQPDPRSESVAIETPAGTITVWVGVCSAGPDSRDRVRILIDRADGWAMSFHRDDFMGEAEIIQERHP
jgi:hypothetical protein